MYLLIPLSLLALAVPRWTEFYLLLTMLLTLYNGWVGMDWMMWATRDG